MADSTPPAGESTALYHLAVQVLHNLEHQHFWSDLKIYTHSPLSPHAQLPRPLVAGVSPRRLYVHPDEQVEQLRKRQIKHTETNEAAQPRDGDDFQPQQEWVLPTQLREKWSLARMAAVFDMIGVIPPAPAQAQAENSMEMENGQMDYRWRKTKRVLLATVDEDSTVVYYIVHDGIVKPRQN